MMSHSSYFCEEPVYSVKILLTIIGLNSHFNIVLFRLTVDLHTYMQTFTHKEQVRS